MKAVHILTVSLVALFFASCSTVRVTSDYKEGTEFNNFSTYEIMAPDNLSEYVSPANKMQIEKSIRQEMSARQFQETPLKADFSVGYFVIINSVRDYNDYVTLYGNRRWGYAVVETNVHEYKEGTLIIDIVDNKKNEVVWHGSVSDTVSKNMKNVNGKIDEAVKAIFNKYAKETALASK